jgi:hypothetical protein
MTGSDRKGRKVSVDKSGRRELSNPFDGLTLQEARALLARILLSGKDPSFGAKIVRTSRATLYRDASTIAGPKLPIE